MWRKTYKPMQTFKMNNLFSQYSNDVVKYNGREFKNFENLPEMMPQKSLDWGSATKSALGGVPTQASAAGIAEAQNGMMGERIYYADMGDLAQQIGGGNYARDNINPNAVFDKSEYYDTHATQYDDVAIVIYGIGHASLYVRGTEYNYGSYQDHSAGWSSTNSSDVSFSGSSNDLDSVSDGYLWIAQNARVEKIFNDGDCTCIYLLFVSSEQADDLLNFIAVEINKCIDLTSEDKEHRYRSIINAQRMRYNEGPYQEYRLITRNCSQWVVHMLKKVLGKNKRIVLEGRDTTNWAEGDLPSITPAGLDINLYNDYMEFDHLVKAYEGEPYIVRQTRQS